MRLFIICILFLFFGITFITSNGYKTYRIKKGETLWKISKNHGVSIDELCQLNKISDVTKVKIGEKIKIPILNKNIENNQSSNETEYKIYYLKKNETLWRISKRYNTTIRSPIKVSAGFIFSSHKSVDTIATLARPTRGAAKNITFEAPAGISVSLPKSFTISING